MHGIVAPGGGVQAGPLLVIAGAGTGKTSTLAHRVAHLVLQGVAAERMLLLTFTRRAALEMTRRAQRVMTEALAAQAGTTHRVPDTLRLPWSGTFHAIGNRLIREYAARLGAGPGFQRARPRRCRRPDGRRAAPARVLEDREALSAQGHLPRHLLASRQHAAAAARHARDRVPVVRGVGGRSSRRCAAPTSRRSSSSRCSTTTTCCCTGT